MMWGMWRLRHRPALDGLRGVAILFVLTTHLRVPGCRQLGTTGVTMFFALSGFLITASLLEERQGSGTFSITGFYRRRAARLAPALLVTVVLAVLADLVVLGHVADWSLVVGALTWTSNFMLMDGHSPVTPLSHTWSLAVEEQFYLLWPLVLLALAKLRRRYAVLLIAYLVVGSAIARAHVYDPTVSVGHSYLGLDARADQLLLGAMLAVASVGSLARRRPPPWLAAAALLGVLLIGLFVPQHLIVPTVVAALTVPVLHVASRTDVPFLQTHWLTWVGLRAYGIYLYHRPIGFLVDAAVPGNVWWVSAPFTLALTLLAAWASFRWLETPIRDRYRYRDGEREHPGRDAGDAPAELVGAALADAQPGTAGDHVERVRARGRW